MNEQNTKWLDVLQDNTLTSVSYERLQSAMRGTELPELVVQHHGVDNHFQAVFPFSWVVRDLVDRLLQQVNTTNKAATHYTEEDSHGIGNLMLSLAVVFSTIC